MDLHGTQSTDFWMSRAQEASDIGIKKEIYSIINQLAERGCHYHGVL